MLKSLINTKKGIPLNQAFGAILMLVLLGVLVIIAIFLFVNLGATFNAESASTTNETGAFVNITGYTIDNVTACSFNTPVATAVWANASNVSGTFLIPTANYTLSSSGVLTNATIVPAGSVIEYNDASISYTYLWGGAACDATDTMITQFGTYPILVGLVGTIIFLGLVIGVLVASFVFGGRRKGV